MKKLKNFAKKFRKDEKGQGTAEYILLLAIVAGVLVLFGPRIKEAVMAKVGNIEGQISEIGQ